MAEQHLKGIRRFGARYGRTPKLKFAKIESEQRRKHKCPYCNAIKVKRVAVGIWNCGKCETKFTGKAYTVSKKPVDVQQTPVQEIPEIPEEPEEQEDFEEDQEEDQEPKTEETEQEKQYEALEPHPEDSEDFGEEETNEGNKQ